MGYHTLQASQDNELHIHVELKSEFEPKRCPHCQCSRIQSKGRYLRKVRHLECFQERTRLLIKSRRFRCLACGRSFIPDFPGIMKGRHTSEPYRQAIFEQHHQGVCTRTIARRQGLGEATVERIYRQFTGRKAAERLSLQCPLVLGIDEHTLHKGQRFCTTFCDLKNHRIFEVQPGRSEADLVHFLSKLKGRERVQLVCIDLSSPYRRLVQRYFPNARIVADRFHAIRIINPLSPPCMTPNPSFHDPSAKRKFLAASQPAKKRGSLRMKVCFLSFLTELSRLTHNTI